MSRPSWLRHYIRRRSGSELRLRQLTLSSSCRRTRNGTLKGYAWLRIPEFTTAERLLRKCGSGRIDRPIWIQNANGRQSLLTFKLNQLLTGEQIGRLREQPYRKLDERKLFQAQVRAEKASQKREDQARQERRRKELEEEAERLREELAERDRRRREAERRAVLERQKREADERTRQQTKNAKGRQRRGARG